MSETGTGNEATAPQAVYADPLRVPARAFGRGWYVPYSLAHLSRNQPKEQPHERD